MSLRFFSTLTATALVLAGCSVGPDYVRPGVTTPVRFKELKGWTRATPAEAADRGPWWTVYNDPVLNALEAQVDISNQNIRAAEANYRQSVALVKEAQAGLFPTLAGTYSGERSHEGPKAGSGGGGFSSASGSGSSGGGGGGANGITRNSFSWEGSASWDLDVWGRIRRQIQSDVAAAQVNDADLANAKLSAQAQLATAYFNLRTQDSLHTLLADTVAAFQRTLTITQNQYAAGTAARSDVDNALAQLKTTQAMEIGTGVQRAQFEHAVAVLIGKAPADLTVRTGALGSRPVMVPPRLPSTLLQRRPDIAAAERTMQEQNELIGVNVAAFYPDFSLSSTFGGAGSVLLPLTAGHEIWSFGGQATDIVLDGGQRLAAVAAASATYDASVATYRQTVLTAFQQVEDELAALRILDQQAHVEDEAIAAARNAVQITLNEYQAGTVSFTSVVTAQATLLGDEQTALSIRQSRYIASVSLIQALGGGWTAGRLVSSDKVKQAPTPTTDSPDHAPDVFTPKVRIIDPSIIDPNRPN